MSDMIPIMVVAAPEMNCEMQNSHMKSGDKMKSKKSDIDKGISENNNDEDYTTDEVLKYLQTAIKRAEEALNDIPDLIKIDKVIRRLKYWTDTANTEFITKTPPNEEIKTEVQEIISIARKLIIKLREVKMSLSSQNEAWEMKKIQNEKNTIYESKQTLKTYADENCLAMNKLQNLRMWLKHGILQTNDEDEEQMNLEENSKRQRNRNVTDDNDRSSETNSNGTRGSQEKRPWCRICVKINSHDKNHKIPECETLKSLGSTRNKLLFVNEHKICSVCFKNNHSSHACERAFKCSSHKVNIAICGCERQVKSVQHKTKPGQNQKNADIYMHSIRILPKEMIAVGKDVIEGKIEQPKTRSIETQTDFTEDKSATNTDAKTAQTKKKKKKPKKKQQISSATQQVDVYKPHEVEQISNEMKMNLYKCFKIIPKWTIWILFGMSIVGLLMRTDSRIMNDDSVPDVEKQQDYSHLMNLPNDLQKLSLKNIMKLKQLENENEFIALVLNTDQVRLTEKLNEQENSENDSKCRSQADVPKREVKQQSNLSPDDTDNATADEMIVDRADNPDAKGDYMKVTDENVLQNLKLMILTL